MCSICSFTFFFVCTYEPFPALLIFLNCFLERLFCFLALVSLRCMHEFSAVSKQPPFYLNFIVSKRINNGRKHSLGCFLRMSSDISGHYTRILGSVSMLLNASLTWCAAFRLKLWTLPLKTSENLLSSPALILGIKIKVDLCSLHKFERLCEITNAHMQILRVGLGQGVLEMQKMVQRCTREADQTWIGWVLILKLTGAVEFSV